MSVEGPPLGLNVEVTAPDGSVKRWGSHGDAGDIPKGLSFNTKRGDGFADANCTLSRRIDGEYVDLGLYRDLTISGDDGSVAYEGRVTGLPRSMGDTHEISVQAAGWMSHAQDRKFREIYVDRDLGKWQGQSAAFRADLLSSNNTPNDPSNIPDPTSGLPSIDLTFSDVWVAPYVMRANAMYDSAGIDLGALYWAWRRAATLDWTDANWAWRAQLCTTDRPGFSGTLDQSASQRGAGPGTILWTSAGAGRTFALIQLYYGAAGGVAGKRQTLWSTLAVYGTHGLTIRGTGAGGFYVSDMIRDICTRFAPKLNTAGVQDTTYIVEQAAFTDALTPYEAWTQLNAFHRWSLSVWENRTLTFAPVDLTDYDWEVRLGDPGVSIDLQGDSAQALANGIAVNYTDAATGQAKRLDPDGYAELRDDTVENPVNLAGLKVWQELPVGFPCTQDMALQLGRAALAEFNSPKAPGTIKVRGHIRDRAGHLQPAWKVRADQRIAITNMVNDRPRLIVETSYSADNQEVSISVDAPAQRLDAVLDRIQSGLTAGGVG